jgi:predicted glutamine amidotransferase
MCRLFALHARTPSSVYHSLWSAPTALARQSVKHPDGWGVAHLEDGELRVTRALGAAHGSEAFRDHVKALTASLVLAHIRKASVGGHVLENTHPFTHDGWVFAHNGTIRKFETRRGDFEQRIDPGLRTHLSGETDSERCFFLFLSELARAPRGETVDRASRALARVATYARQSDPRDLPRPSVANFVATNGDVLLALRFGKMLHIAAREGEPLRSGTQLDALLVASEPTEPTLQWHKLSHGQGVAIDRRRTLHRFDATRVL